MVEYQVIVRDALGKTGIYSRHKTKWNARKSADRVRERIRRDGWVKGKHSVFIRKSWKKK